MIRRFSLNYIHAFRQPGDATATPLFQQAKSLRKIRIVIDADLYNQNADEGSVSALLTGFLSHENVEFFRIADEGPPGDAPSKSRMGRKFYPGWIVIGEQDHTSHIQPIAWSDNDRAVVGAIQGNLHEIVENDNKTDAYKALGSIESRRRRIADASAAQAAAEVNADLFITEREYVLSSSWSRFDEVNACTPGDALPLISLYLRSRDVFVASMTDSFSLSYNKGYFFRVGVREYLPGSWRWHSACVLNSQMSGASELAHIAGSVLNRMIRVLQNRDRLLIALNQPQNNDVAEEALIAFDSAMVFMMGALDGTALIANQAFGVNANSKYVNWQNAGWISQIEKHTGSKSVSQLLAPGTEEACVLIVLRHLRNTVHGAGLQPISSSSGSRRQSETLIDLSGSLSLAKYTEFLTAAENLGGKSAWSIDDRHPQLIVADPGVILEQLLPRVFKLLDALMKLTPVENLGTPDATSIRPEDQMGMTSVRQQLGLHQV